jgi:hypothetical protein
MKELKFSFDARIEDLHLNVGDLVKVAGHTYRFTGREVGGRDQFNKLVPHLRNRVYDVLEPVD